MKKNLILGLVTLGAASMLCGFDSAETAESLQQKMQEASSSQTSVDMNMAMNLDAAVNMSDGTTDSSIGIKMDGNFDVACLLEPFGMMMDGSMNLSTFGTSQALTMKMYGVTNDAGELETYVYTEDSSTGEAGTWAYENAGAFDMNEILEASKSMEAVDLSDWGITFTLAPEAADVDGKECYLLSTVMDSNTLSTVIDKTSELSGQDLAADDDVAQMLSLLTGLKINVAYYIDTTSYQLVKMHMDMNDSDLAVLNELIQASMPTDGETTTTAEIVLNDFSIDAVVSSEEVAPITVPQEALDAVASGAAVSAEDVVDGVEDVIEE